MCSMIWWSIMHGQYLLSILKSYMGCSCRPLGFFFSSHQTIKENPVFPLVGTKSIKSRRRFARKSPNSTRHLKSIDYCLNLLHSFSSAPVVCLPDSNSMLSFSPRKRLCLGSITCCLTISKYGNSSSTEYWPPC